MGEQTTALSTQEGWHSEGYAARVHYEGGADSFSVEYYEPTGRIVYWRIEAGGDRAVPVGRDSVPEPLRTRIREDLVEAGIDPDLERELL